MKHLSPGDRSPWGAIQHVKVVVPNHIYVVDTASHGGIKLSREYNALVNPKWRAKGGWYEEDVDMAIVLITFQNSFPKGQVNIDNVRSTLARYYPEAYSDWWPIEKSIEAERGRPYDAAEIKAEAEKASAELARMFPKPRKKKPARVWRQQVRGVPVITIDPGDYVICDMCGRDVTDDPAEGGFIFGSYGVCPYCAEEFMKGVKEAGEEEFIRYVAPPGISHADWIRQLRAEGKI